MCCHISNGGLVKLVVDIECSDIGRWVQKWCGLMPPLLSLCMCVSLSLFALLRHSLGHGRSTSESLYEEEMVIASSLQTSEWPDLTGSLLQPLWLSVMFSHSHSPLFVFKVPWTFPKRLDRLIILCESATPTVFFHQKKILFTSTRFFLPVVRLASITRLDALQLCYTIWCVVISWYVCVSTYSVGLDVWTSHRARQKVC